MAIVIREADLSAEMDLLRATYDANREAPASAERFPWLYLGNPDGRAKAWLAVDDTTGAVAGFTAVFPRRVRVAGHSAPVVAWNCGDFSIHKRYRTMGVAVKLRRAAKDEVDRGEPPFLYAHPNDRMLAVHLQAGHRQMGRMARYVKVLAVGRGVIASLARLALVPAGLDAVVRVRHDIEWLTSTPVPADIDDVYETVAARLGTSLVRNHTYLDWRFRQCPVEPIEMAISREAGRPVAYVAFVVKGTTLFVKDWLSVDASTFDQVMTAVVREARRRRLHRVSLTALDTHPHLPRLGRFGFLEREEASSAVVTYTPPGSGFEAVLDPRTWYMTVGDRDV